MMKKFSVALCLAAVLAPVVASAHQAGDFIFRAGTGYRASDHQLR
ncbi:outer membrane protein W [Edwardsiella tarda]|nr:outer membrane protein W [Edwardsiella tarda]